MSVSITRKETTKRKRTTAFALIIATAATAAIAFDASDMHQGRTMLEAQISNAFKEYGIEQDLTVLSLSQIARIEAALTETDYSNRETKDATRNN